MRNHTGNHGRLISRSTAGGLVLLLILAGWTPMAAEAQMTRSDWPQVQAVKPGTPITVLLHKDQGLRGKRKVRGRFHSATGDSLTLERKDGQKRTLSKSAVRKVLVHRPLRKRYAVWIAPLVSTVIFGPSLYRSEDFTVVDAGKFIGIPTGLAFLATPKKSEIYHVPPKYRMQPPADKPSGAEGKASGNTSP